MNTQSEAPIVVGYDGSPAAGSGLRVGASLAAFHRVTLRIVHAYAWPVLFAPLANLPFRADDWTVPPAAAAMLDRARSTVLASYDDLRVETAVVVGSGAPVLIEESMRASLVVIGSRGVGGVAGALAGSVTAQLATRAWCPVVVVGPRGRAAGNRDLRPCRRCAS